MGASTPTQTQKEIVYSDHHRMKNYGGDGSSHAYAREFRLIEAGDIDEDATMALNLQLYRK